MQDFREWLAERVGDKPLVSRRELARRMAARNTYDGDQESHRKTIRRILEGETPHPRQRTRDLIQEALDDWSAPAADDEKGRPITADELRVWRSVNSRLAKQMVPA